MYRVERFEAVDADSRRPGGGEHLRRGEPAGVRRPPEAFVHLHLEPDRRPLERDLVMMLEVLLLVGNLDESTRDQSAVSPP